MSGHIESLWLLTAPSFSWGFLRPNNYMYVWVLWACQQGHSWQTPGWPEAIQKLDTTKAKTRSRLAKTRGGIMWLTNDQPSLTTWNQIINIHSQHLPIYFSFCSSDPCCIFADVLYCLCGFSAASRFNFTSLGLLRQFMYGDNCNTQLIIRQNKWQTSSAFHSQVTFTWLSWGFANTPLGNWNYWRQWLLADVGN